MHCHWYHLLPDLWRNQTAERIENFRKAELDIVDSQEWWVNGPHERLCLCWGYMSRESLLQVFFSLWKASSCDKQHYSFVSVLELCNILGVIVSLHAILQTCWYQNDCGYKCSFQRWVFYPYLLSVFLNIGPEHLPCLYIQIGSAVRSVSMFCMCGYSQCKTEWEPCSSPSSSWTFVTWMHTPIWPLTNQSFSLNSRLLVRSFSLLLSMTLEASPSTCLLMEVSRWKRRFNHSGSKDGHKGKEDWERGKQLYVLKSGGTSDGFQMSEGSQSMQEEKTRCKGWEAVDYWFRLVSIASTTLGQFMLMLYDKEIHSIYNTNHVLLSKVWD